MRKLSFEERRAIREIARERLRVRYELDSLSLDRRELLERLRYDKEAQRYSQELLSLEARIDALKEQLDTRLSPMAVGERFNVSPNTISSLTTARYR